MKTPAPKPFSCPRCGSEQIDCILSALCDGIDKKSHWVSEYGICKQCGSRCARRDDEPSYVPSDDEWQSNTKLVHEMREKRAKWPFIGDDDVVA